MRSIMKAFLNTTNKNLITIITLLLIITLLSECKKVTVYEPKNITSNKIEDNTEVINSPPACEKTIDLMAGQHINIGTVHYINNPNGYVDVTYTVKAPWKISFVSLYMGTCSGIPKNSSGNVTPGLFPYKESFETGQTSVTISVPRSSVPTCGCIAAHASVYNTETKASETAWGNGSLFTDTNWAMYNEYCLADCADEYLGCGYTIGYWFVEKNNALLPEYVSVGNYHYTPGEIFDIWYIAGLSNNADARLCFVQVATVKLNSSTIPIESGIWNKVEICESYLKTIEHKLSSNYLPTGNEEARNAANIIKSWVETHKCN